MSTLVTTVSSQVFDTATLPAGTCIRVTPKKTDSAGNTTVGTPFFGLVMSCSKVALTYSYVSDSAHAISNQIKVEDVIKGSTSIEIIPLVDPVVNPAPVTP